MTLTVGRNEGVVPFSPVVAPEGLVGMIETVDASSSVAIVWPHPDFRASAMSADGTAFGIVYPHLGRGATRFLLELRGVAFRKCAAPGHADRECRAGRRLSARHPHWHVVVVGTEHGGGVGAQLPAAAGGAPVT